MTILKFIMKLLPWRKKKNKKTRDDSIYPMF